MFRRLPLIIGLLLSFCFCFGTGLVIGLLLGERGAYHRRYLEERDAMASVIATDLAFAGVEVEERSDDGIYLQGKVPTPADMDRLRGHVVRTIGESRTNVAMTAVRVRR